MKNILDIATQSVRESKAAWCRYITANDTGSTGSHQAGFYVPKCASPLLFNEPGIKGENKEKMVEIRWQDDFVTESCMKYYGQGTRNEYRITRFGRGFPFLQDDNIGDLLIIAKQSEDYYTGFVLSTDDDIDNFLACFNLSPDETNQLIDVTGTEEPEQRIAKILQDFANQCTSFPETKQMALGARECYNKAFGVSETTIKSDPDAILLKWIDTEYSLFKVLEEKLYAGLVSKPFESVEAFVKAANEVLNRRKSRAGKSLEHHLADIFIRNKLIFEEQAITEENKKPDFLFPNAECYHNLSFPASDLVVLGAKTTCKDRWRQVLTEADRIKEKYLFTLQQGISRNQLKEMSDAHLTLVVPRKYLPSFPKEYQNRILNLSTFVNMVRTKQKTLPKFFLF